MDKFNEGIQAFLKPGPQLFVPIIIFIFALIVRVKIKSAIRSSLLIGVAFIATSLVMSSLVGWIQPVFDKLGEYMHFDTIDVGWIGLATLAWAWPYAFLMFPIQIGINAIMIWTKKTKTLNIDLWNIWHKPFLAMLVIGVVGAGWVGILLGFLAASTQVIVELKNGDLVQPAVKKITKIDNVTVPHAVGLFGAVLFPVDSLLRRFKFFKNENLKPNTKKSKRFGIFFENDILGFMLGMLLGFIGWESEYWYRPFVLGIEVSAALLLLPIAAKFFVKSLNPITNQIQKTMQEKYNDRELYVGLDFPVLVGSQKLWLAMAIWVPLTLAYSFLFTLSGHGIFPLAMIINTSMGIPALLITGGNIRRMIALGIIYSPLFLFVGTWAGNIVTQGIIDNHVGDQAIKDAIAKGYKISSSGMEMPLIRYVVPNALGMFTGKITANTIAGITLFPILISLWITYYIGMKKRIANGDYNDVHTQSMSVNNSDEYARQKKKKIYLKKNLPKHT